MIRMVNAQKHKTGAHTLLNEYANYMSPQEFWFKLLFYSNATTKFYPTGKSGRRYDCINFNNYTKQVELQTWKISTKKDKEGESYLDTAKPVLGCEIVGIKRIENSIIPSANPKYVFEYIPTGRNNVVSITATTMKELQDKIKEQIGIPLNSSYPYVLNQIVAFFTRNNLIETSSVAPVGGIFELDGELKRFDYDLNEIQPTFNKTKLLSGLELLMQIRDIIPTDNDKFGAIIRAAILLPFTHVLKQHGHMARYLCLIGSGKTLKSTIAELLINLYNPTRKSSKDGNIFSAGSFASEYQVGIKFGISGYPAVVNECGKAFQDDNIVEILKSAIESNIARSTADGTYYSYNSLIFTSNPDIKQSDAMIRRCQLFYFAPSERASEDDIDKLADLLNRSGVNSRFVELNEIGQFVFSFIHNNLHLLDELSTEELEIHIVEELEKETGIDLDWMKQDVKEDNNTIIEEIDNEVLADFLQEIKKVYNFHFRTFDYTAKDAETNLYTTKPVAFTKTELVSIASRGLCPFIVYNDKEDKIFIVGNRVKQFFTDTQQKVVSNGQLYDEFLIFKEYYDVEKTQMMIGGKRYRGIICDPILIVDLLNNTLRGDYGDE